MMQWYAFGRSEQQQQQQQQNQQELGEKELARQGHEGDWSLGHAVIPDIVGSPRLGKVRCGQYHTVATSSAPGKVAAFAWGVNTEGQLALQSEGDGSPPDPGFAALPRPCLETYRPLLERDGEQIVECCAGRTHSMFLTKPTGRLFIAGHLPASATDANSDSKASAAPPAAAVAATTAATAPGHHPTAPREVTLSCLDSVRAPSGKIVSCSAGERSSFVLTSEGEVFAVVEGCSSSPAPSLKVVANLPVIARIAAGANHTLFLTMEGQIYSMGSGNFGQLGLGHSRRHADQPTLVTLPALCTGRVRDISAGLSSSFAVTATGSVFAWGCNTSCQLGLGTAIQGVSTAKSIDCLAHIKVVQVAAGAHHTACISFEGALYLWGNGSYGQLGFSFDETKACAMQGCAGSSTCSRTPAIIRSKETSSARGLAVADAGHSSPWVQVWPRRCCQGPFLVQRCREVQCGAYHTTACASDESLETKQSYMEVLTPPPPLRRAPGAAGGPAGGSGSGSSSGRAGDSHSNSNSTISPGGVGAAGESLTAAEGKSGVATPLGEFSAAAAEASRLRLNALSAAVRKTGVPLDSDVNTFHSLAKLFWTIPGETTEPSEKVEKTAKAPEVTETPKGRRPADAGEWRRALLPKHASPWQHNGSEVVDPEARCSPPKAHPLCSQSQDTRKRVGIHTPTSSLRLPAVGGPILWDVVDEALHQAFATGAAFETQAHVELPRLVLQVQGVQGPIFAQSRSSESKPLPPFRGLVRNEGLIPRPFYLPEDTKSSIIVGAALPGTEQQQQQQQQQQPALPSPAKTTAGHMEKEEQRDPEGASAAKREVKENVTVEEDDKEKEKEKDEQEEKKGEDNTANEKEKEQHVGGKQVEAKDPGMDQDREKADSSSTSEGRVMGTGVEDDARLEKEEGESTAAVDQTEAVPDPQFQKATGENAGVEASSNTPASPPIAEEGSTKHDQAVLSSNENLTSTDNESPK